MKTSKTLWVMGIILMSVMAAVAQNGNTKGNYASVNGLKMYYEIQGTGKPLVLLHGGMVTIEYSFDKIQPAFDKTWKTIAIEQQAHGAHQRHQRSAANDRADGGGHLRPAQTAQS